MCANARRRSAPPSRSPDPSHRAAARRRPRRWCLRQRRHKASREIYGAPRIGAELADQGIHVGRKRVERLVKADGLAGVSWRKGPRSTLRDERVRPAPDLVDRNFRTEAPDRLWIADITYVPTWTGFLYLAAACKDPVPKRFGKRHEVIHRGLAASATRCSNQHPSAKRVQAPRAIHSAISEVGYLLLSVLKLNLSELIEKAGIPDRKLVSAIVV